MPVPLYPTLGVEATANIFRDSEAKVVVTIGWFRTGVDESAAGAANIRHVLEPSDLEADAARSSHSPPSARTTSPSSSTRRAARGSRAAWC